MVLATTPLIDCCPIVPARMEGRQMVMWDKDSCSDAGFLKIDLLGLGMLSAVERCVQTIAERHPEPVDLSRIPFDDQAVYERIQLADTVGVFQIESRAQMGSLRRTRPESLADLTIQVALVRPGPIVGGSVSPYIERKQRQAIDPDFQIEYLHPSLEEPLKQTLGTIIFQDQVIEVARAFAGFTAGQAESLRRAMSRKRSQQAIDAHHDQFISGALTTHPDVTEPLAEQVFSMVRGFAGFGFPKGHGAAFGLLAYQSTWLKHYYPAEFLCGLLERAADGVLPTRQPHPRRTTPRPEDPPAGRQPQRRGVHRHPRRTHPDRPRLHQGNPNPRHPNTPRRPRSPRQVHPPRAASRRRRGQHEHTRTTRKVRCLRRAGRRRTRCQAHRSLATGDQRRQHIRPHAGRNWRSSSHSTRHPSFP